MTEQIDISRDHESGRGYILRTACRLLLPPEQVFPFFADPDNLGYLTPDWLHLKILSREPEQMGAGVQIRYRIRLHGIPFRWRTEITAWQPSESFVDEARRSPYRYWRHEHRFTSDGDGTLAEDIVRYDVPGGDLVHRLFVRRNLLAIFAYRREQLAKRFGIRATEEQGDERSRVAAPSGRG